MFQPDPQIMQALMQRPKLMQMMMTLMQKGAAINPAKLQKASESGDKAELAKMFGMKEEEFDKLQADMAKELGELSQQFPQMEQMAAQMAKQMGVELPKQE